MEERPLNPIIKMLAWRVKKLKVEEIQRALAAIASIEDRVFTLTDVIELLPDEVKVDRNRRRRVGNLLLELASLGYLSKPSERKWVKNAPSFSHFLSQHLLELSSIERLPPRPPISGKVISQRQKLEKQPSK